MAPAVSGRVQAPGSSVTAALPPARLTLASRTPGSPRSAFSIVITQAAQVIPATGTISSSILVCFFSCDMAVEWATPRFLARARQWASLPLGMTPDSARLAPLSPRDQVVQPLTLRLQLIDDLRRGSRVPWPAVRLATAMPHAHHHPVATVATVIACRAPPHDPSADNQAHHHQGADQQQQQYRYPYRPFHLCAPSSARPDSCSLFLVPYLFAISYSSISSLITSSSRPSRMPEATQVWRWPSRIIASIFSMARRTAYVCLRTSGQYLSSWIMRRTPARWPSM